MRRVKRGTFGVYEREREAEISVMINDSSEISTKLM